jgi:adenylate cyclase
VEDHANPSAWLESGSGDRTPIRGSCFLGRAATSTIVLPSDKASRRHAMVHAQGQDEFWLVDLGSANGTYLNGRRVSQPCRLSDGDTIKIADFLYTFHYPTTSVASGAPGPNAEKTIQDIKSLDCWLLVADMESSTQFTSRLPADEAPRVTGRWLAECKQIIDEQGGAINKFLGDGFFAYWQDRDGAAASVVRVLLALKEQQSRQPRFRLVVHYGKVFAGGAASMGEESLLGNEVNFVFRMEKMAASIGAPRLLSEAAQEQIKAILPTEEEGRQALAGFEGDFLFFRF